MTSLFSCFLFCILALLQSGEKLRWGRGSPHDNSLWPDIPTSVPLTPHWRWRQRSGKADSVLVAVDESLSKTKLDALSRKEGCKDKLGKCISQAEFQEPAAEDKLRHSYSRSTARQNALYYKSSTRANSPATLVPTDHCPPVAKLPQMRSFVPSALQHPSDALTSMLVGPKCVTEKRTEKKEIFGDLFRVFEVGLPQNTLVRVGCSAHFEELSACILKFYSVTRMHFYARQESGQSWSRDCDVNCMKGFHTWSVVL